VVFEGVDEGASRCSKGHTLRTRCPLHHLQQGVYVGCASGRAVLIDPDREKVLASSLRPEAEALAEDEAAAESSRDVSEAQQDSSITCVAVNADAVVVCSGGSKQPLRWFSRAGGGGTTSPRQLQELRQAGQVLGTAGAVSVELGGPLLRDALVTTQDSCILLISPLPPPASSPSSAAAPQVEPLADWHAGCITGVVPLPGSGGKLLSGGVDGCVRVWDASAGWQLVGRRDFVGAKLTSITACDKRALIAVGSSSGVLRLVGTAADASSLPVLWRGRIARGPLTAVSFAPGGSLVAALCSSSSTAGDSMQQRDWVALLSVGRGSAEAGGLPVQLLGYADCGDKVLSIAWLPAASDILGGGSADCSHTLVASLQGGMLLSLKVSASITAVAGGAAAAGSSELSSMQLYPEQLHPQLLALETPLSRIAAVQLSQKGRNGNTSSAACVVGLSATDRKLHRFELPAADDSSAWSAASRGKPPPLLKAAASVVSHDKAGTALAVSPCGRWVASVGGDGCVVLRDANSLAAVTTSGEAAAAATLQLRPHALVRGAHQAAVCFDGSGQWLATASGEDGGSLFLHQVGVAPAIGFVAADVAAEEHLLEACADAADHTNEPLLPDLLAAEARAAEERAGAAARAEVAHKLEQLQQRLMVLLARNEAAPEGERLSAEEVIINVGRLQQLRSEADAEAAALKAKLTESVARDEIVAARIKEEFWDCMEVKPAAVTGIVSQQEIWNFPLRREDGARYKEVAALRGVALLDLAAWGEPGLGQLLRRRKPTSATGAAESGPAAATSAAPQQSRAAVPPLPVAAAVDGAAASGRTTDVDENDASGSGAKAASSNAATEPSSAQQSTAGQQPGRTATASGRAAVPREVVEALEAGRAVAPERLLYDELEVTTPVRKVAQAEILSRMARDLKAR